MISAYAAPGIKSLSDTTEEKIVEKVCDYFKIPVEKIMKSKRGKAPVVYCRDWIIHFIITKTDLSLEDIGNFIGGRHWSTIIYARNKVLSNLLDKMYTFHDKYKRDYEQLIQII